MGIRATRHVRNLLVVSLLVCTGLCGVFAEASQPLLTAADIRENIYCTAMISKADYLMAGDRGRIYRSGDGGKSWTAVEVPARQRLFWIGSVNLGRGNGWMGFGAGANGLFVDIREGKLIW
jgi:hypothetical protein